MAGKAGNAARAFFIALIVMAMTTVAQIISGSASIRLTGPVTKEQTDHARSTARSKLRIELLSWMDENLGIAVDTLNSLDNYTLDIFIDSCTILSKQESSFSGMQWNFAYNLSAETAQKIIVQHNAQFDSLANQTWSLLTSAIEAKDDRAVYTQAIKALSYANAHLGPPIQTPGATGRDLIDDTKRALQSLLDRMQVKASEMILKGKAGQYPESPPSITVLIDSVPFPGFSYTTMLPTGKQLISVSTDENGIAQLADLRIPFVANGTFLYASPNLGAGLGINRLIEAKDFGVKLNKSQDQTFIFKILRPTFTLDYQASSVSKVAISPELANDAYIKKFLRDSCYLELITGTTPPDLAISMHSQISSYNHDETEETAVKMTSQITVKALSLDPPKTTQELLSFEKRYEQRVDLPLGLFYWEASSKLRTGIRAILEQL